MLDRAPVRDGQRTGMREADRARARVLGRAVLELAAAEHLRARLQVRVHLEPDDGLHRHSGRSFAAHGSMSPRPRPSRPSPRAPAARARPRSPPRVSFDVTDEHGARAVEDARRRAEDALDRGDEVGRRILERRHRIKANRLFPGRSPHETTQSPRTAGRSAAGRPASLRRVRTARSVPAGPPCTTGS